MKYLILFILVIIASIAGVVYYKSTPPLTSQISIAPVVDEIVSVGINLPAGKTITPHDVQTGVYPILVYQTAANQYVIDIPRQLGHLNQFDSNNDGNINRIDPIFANLAFGYISHDGKKICFVPIGAAGVSDIILDITHMAEQKKMGVPSGDWNVGNIYVMADNSRWVSTHVALPTSFLMQLVASDPKQKIIYPGAEKVIK